MAKLFNVEPVSLCSFWFSKPRNGLLDSPVFVFVRRKSHRSWQNRICHLVVSAAATIFPCLPSCVSFRWLHLSTFFLAQYKNGVCCCLARAAQVGRRKRENAANSFFHVQLAKNCRSSLSRGPGPQQSILGISALVVKMQAPFWHHWRP